MAGPAEPPTGLPAPLAWLDGRIVREDEPHLRVSDRGFQLGDGVFETLRARRGVAIEAEEHLARLRESAAALAIRLPFDDAALRVAIRDLLAAAALAGRGDAGGPVGDAALRITASRGPLPGRALLPAPGSPPATVVVQAWPFAPPAERLLREGVRAITSTFRREPTSPLASVKTTSRADHVAARLEAERAGADDAIHLTTDGRLAESTTANLFLVREARLLTPALDAGILAGTTRTWLLARAAGLGAGLAGVEEAELVPADLPAADEAFLSASVSGIVPLTSLDGRPIGTGRPGPLTLALREARERWIDAVSRGDPAATGGGS